MGALGVLGALHLELFDRSLVHLQRGNPVLDHSALVRARVVSDRRLPEAAEGLKGETLPALGRSASCFRQRHNKERQ